jgi:hypothetical protein
VTFSIFNPRGDSSDQGDAGDGTSRCRARALPHKDDLRTEREARLAEVRALIEDIAEPAVEPACGGLQC